MKVLTSSIKYIILSIAISTSTFDILAQGLLKVQTINSTITDYPIQNIRKLTFPTSSTLQIDMEKSVQNILVSDIRKLSFASVSTPINSVKIEKPQFRLYPVPVKSQLTIEFETPNSGSVQIEIVDFLGHTVYEENRMASIGSNQLTIQSSMFKQGFYICKVKTSTFANSIRFLKQN